MRSLVLASMIANGMSVFALAAASAAPVLRDVIEVRSMVEQGRYDSRHCRHLRRACQSSVGSREVCRRYRRECGGRIY
jgi:hypothetical protein